MKNALKNFTTSLVNCKNKALLATKKHSPEILIVTGIVGVISAAVLACKATTKASEIMKQAKEDLEAVNKVAEENHEEEYTEEDKRKDIVIIVAQTGVKLAKVYGPAIGVGILSIISILASHDILRKRNLALSAAYAVVDSSFKKYRDRVIERFGEKVDKELRYNVKHETVKEEVVDPETGKKKTVKQEVDYIDEDSGVSEYARFFDESCPAWEKDAENNLYFLKLQEQYMTQKLRSRGYLFLNEVYEAIGIPPTKAGQIVGWVYDPENGKGDSFVDLGIYNIKRKENRQFVNGYERSIIIDPNVQGNILNDFNKEF